MEKLGKKLGTKSPENINIHNKNQKTSEKKEKEQKLETLKLFFLLYA